MCEPSKLEDEMKQKAKKGMLSTTDPVQKLKLAFLARGGAGIKGLSRWVRRVDDDGNKKLNKQEFFEGMATLGIQGLKKAEYEEAFDRFDEDGSGQINITEFLLVMQPTMSQRRQNLVAAAFNKFNTNDDKLITVADLKDKYDYSKHPKYLNGDWNGKQCLREFLDSFDDKNEPDGKVNYQEFMSYYAAISCSIDRDAYFDLMMRQAWGIDTI